MQRSMVLQVTLVAFCLLLFVFSIPVLLVGRGVWGIFLAGKKMSERSELFFPEEKYPTPRVPARIPSRLGAQAHQSKKCHNGQLAKARHLPQQRLPAICV